jgi:hypothetical protein
VAGMLAVGTLAFLVLPRAHERQASKSAVP